MRTLYRLEAIRFVAFCLLNNSVDKAVTSHPLLTSVVALTLYEGFRLIRQRLFRTNMRTSLLLLLFGNSRISNQVVAIRNPKGAQLQGGVR